MQVAITVFSAVLLAHLLADFPLQTGRLATLKSRHWWAQIWHGAIHLLVLVLVLRVFVGQLSLITLRAFSAILGYVVLHIAIDVSKQQIIKRGLAGDST